MRRGVLLVDDNPLMRQAIRFLFEATPEFTVYGEAQDGLEAVGKAEKLKPHLIILDFAMPKMNGLDAATQILKKLPTVLIILFTFFAEEMEFRAREIGIHAVVHKGKAATHLIPTARDLVNQVPRGRATKA